MRFDRHLMASQEAVSSWFVVHDLLSSSAAHKYDWLLLTMNAPTRVGPNEWRMTAGQRALTIRVLEPNAARAEVEPVIVTERPGEGSTRQRGHRFSVAAGPALRDAKFLVVLALHAATEPAPAVLSQSGLIGIGTRDLFAPGGAAGPIDTDGHHAAIRKSEGDVVRWAVQDAKRLKFEGALLCESSVPVSASAARNSVTVEANAAAEIAVRAGTRPGNLLLDGKSAKFQYDSGMNLARLHVVAGKHQLEFLRR
jgi:hypothetical protein